jgi:dTDP-glucose pyrophosphorylase
MNLIITMAGRYSRFVDEGYRLPKYLLPWGDKSILKEIILELNKHSDFDNIYLIANKRDEIYMPHVKRIIQSLGLSLENLFLISDTSGQAETASIAISKICSRFGKLNGSIVFHNIDTILYNRKINEINSYLDKNDGYIDIFESSNHAYSYVLIENRRVKSIAEKIVISNSASSGMYAFKDIKTFTKFYKKDMLFISDVYKYMIKIGGSIISSELYSENDTIVLGSPSEYLVKSYLLDSE